MQIVESAQIIVGIDIAKKNHYASILTPKGKMLASNIKIFNNREGFKNFKTVLRKYRNKQVLIGMEPTGHYWKVLHAACMDANYQPVLVNPYHTKLSKEQYDNHNSKNDAKDSFLIGKMVSEGKFSKAIILKGVYADLRKLTTVREKEVRMLTRYKIRLKVLLDEYLPEYEQLFCCVSGTTSLHLLKTFGIRVLHSKQQCNKKIELINTTSRKVISKKRAQYIAKTLEQSVGIQDGLIGAEHDLRCTLAAISLYKNNVALLENDIAKGLEKVDEYKFLKTIKGIGIVTAGLLLGQTGSFAAYKVPVQLEKLAGMMLKSSSSGQYKGKTRISKRGRSLLRHGLYRIAISLICNNAEFKSLYKYKLQQKKKAKQIIITSIATKFLRTAFYMVKNKCNYDGNYILRNIPMNTVAGSTSHGIRA